MLIVIDYFVGKKQITFSVQFEKVFTTNFTAVVDRATELLRYYIYSAMLPTVSPHHSTSYNIWNYFVEKIWFMHALQNACFNAYFLDICRRPEILSLWFLIYRIKIAGNLH